MGISTESNFKFQYYFETTILIHGLSKWVKDISKKYHKCNRCHINIMNYSLANPYHRKVNVYNIETFLGWK